MCHIVHVGEYACLNECALLAHAESLSYRENGVHATACGFICAIFFYRSFFDFSSLLQKYAFGDHREKDRRQWDAQKGRRT